MEADIDAITNAARTLNSGVDALKRSKPTDAVPPDAGESTLILMNALAQFQASIAQLIVAGDTAVGDLHACALAHQHNDQNSAAIFKNLGGSQ